MPSLVANNIGSLLYQYWHIGYKLADVTILVEYWTDTGTQCCSQSLCGNIGQSWHNIALEKLNAMHANKSKFSIFTAFHCFSCCINKLQNSTWIQFHFTRKTVWPMSRWRNYTMFKGNVMFQISSIHFFSKCMDKIHYNRGWSVFTRWKWSISDCDMSFVTYRYLFIVFHLLECVYSRILYILCSCIWYACWVVQVVKSICKPIKSLW